MEQAEVISTAPKTGGGRDGIPNATAASRPRPSLDARGRIMAGDHRFGRLCDCGNLKGYQAAKCWTCHLDTVRDDAFWQRRTCLECGGPKSRGHERCMRCEHARRTGVPVRGRQQPEAHPWRQRAA